MADILERIDAAIASLCGCGCRQPLDPSGPSAYFVDADHQTRWQLARTDNPMDVLARPDAAQVSQSDDSARHLPPATAYSLAENLQALDDAQWARGLAQEGLLPQVVRRPLCCGVHWCSLCSDQARFQFRVYRAIPLLGMTGQISWMTALAPGERWLCADHERLLLAARDPETGLSYLDVLGGQ